MDSMSRMFIELPSFRLRWKSLGLSDDDLKNLEKELLDNPKVGDVLQEPVVSAKCASPFRTGVKVAAFV